MDKIIYKGILVGTRSYNNISLDILRSCIKKYSITNNFDKFIWCVIEFDLFLKKEMNKAIINNLLNKLLEIIIEHINIENIPLLIKYNDLSKKWLIDITNKNPLLLLGKYICESKKNNIIFVLNYIFSHIVSKNNSCIIKDCIDVSEIKIEKDYTLGDYWIYYTEKDTQELIQYMDYFIYLLDKSNLKCFYWLFKINELSKLKIKASRRFKRYKPIYAVWEHLYKRCEIENNNIELKNKLNNLLDILLEYYIKRNENNSIIMYACLLFMDKFNYNLEKYDKIDDSFVFSDSDIKTIYNRNLDNQIIDIDYYCMDKTVKEGKNIIHIHLIGSQKNEFIYDITNLPIDYQKLYNIIITKKVNNIPSKNKRKKKIENIIELQEDKINNDSLKSEPKINNKSQEIKDYMENNNTL
jgi:hypothetical protein